MSYNLRNKRMRSETQISEQLDERLTMNVMEDNERVEKKVYAKNSFDRFGDDLTEEVLQYLTLEDKIRLECVSKQWQRYVFQKQFVIEMNFINESNGLRLSGKQFLELLLKKCPNVIKVSLYSEVKDNVLSLIGQNCPRLKSIVFSSVENNEYIISFFRMYGHKIEALEVEDHCEELEQILRHCPNLKKLDLHLNEYHYSDVREYLPKLEELYMDIESEKVQQMKILSVKYSQTMKILDITLACLTEEELKTCFESIARFENLKLLTLDLHPMKTTKPIDDCLSLIGQKCNKLLKLDLIIHKEVPITERFFDVFLKFNAIKKLNIQLLDNTIINGSVECFKHCKQLIELDITSPEMREDFFANIASFVPKLQFLNISTEKQFSETFFDLFKHPKYFQRLDYNYTNSSDITIDSKLLTFGTYCSKPEPNVLDLIHMKIAAIDKVNKYFIYQWNE